MMLKALNSSIFYKYLYFYQKLLQFVWILFLILDKHLLENSTLVSCCMSRNFLRRCRNRQLKTLCQSTDQCKPSQSMYQSETRDCSPGIFKSPPKYTSQRVLCLLRGFKLNKYIYKDWRMDFLPPILPVHWKVRSRLESYCNFDEHFRCLFQDT